MRASLICLFLLSVMFVVPGCKKIDPGRTAVQVDKMKVSKAEFDETFNKSPYGYEDTVENRKKFLDALVSSKLILREAERMGLDKDPGFLHDVEDFWQQALFKLTLNKKMGELSSELTVDDNEIKQYYEAHKQDSFMSDELPAVYENIKWVLIKDKQGKKVQEWIDSLRSKAKIRINEDLVMAKQ